MNDVHMLERPVAPAGLRFADRLAFTRNFGVEGCDSLRWHIDAYLQEPHDIAYAGRRAVAEYVRTEAQAMVVEHKVMLEHSHFPRGWKMNEDGWLEDHRGKEVHFYRPFGGGRYFLFTVDAREDVIIVHVARVMHM